MVSFTKRLRNVEVMRSRREILLSQEKYVLDLLFDTRKYDAKPSSTPIALIVQFTMENFSKTLRNIEDWMKN